MPTDRDWNQRYLDAATPWDSGRPSAELVRVLATNEIPRGRVLELGCGSGTNAIYLAQQGFEVTAIDIAPAALELARQRAEQAHVTINFIEADVHRFDTPGPRFDFLFDRGCYHCCRRIDLAGYLRTHELCLRPDAWALMLTGNADDPKPDGPPKLTAAELTAELEPLYRFIALHEFRFEDPGGIPGPLGWSTLLRKR
ncbi:MAG: class I SAM-dependent methyltransferase [Planctomycetaceae bacterium]